MDCSNQRNHEIVCLKNWTYTIIHLVDPASNENFFPVVCCLRDNFKMSIVLMDPASREHYFLVGNLAIYIKMTLFGLS